MRPYLRPRPRPTRGGRGLARLDDRAPGSLTTSRAPGRVDVSTELGGRGPVPRDDVALVLAETLDAPNTSDSTFELFAGETPAHGSPSRWNQPPADV